MAQSSISANLKVLKVTADKTAVKPGTAINLTYWLISEGQLNYAINMGIYITKEQESTLYFKWGLHSSLLDKLKQAKTISETRLVTLPNWGDGTYIISLQADIDNFVSEPDEKDNNMEVQIKVSSTLLPPPPATVVKSLQQAQAQPTPTTTPAADDLADLKKRINELEKRIEQLEVSQPSSQVNFNNIKPAKLYGGSGDRADQAKATPQDIQDIWNNIIELNTKINEIIERLKK